MFQWLKDAHSGPLLLAMLRKFPTDPSAKVETGIPGLHGPLLLQRSKLLRIHRQAGRVDDFGLPVAVGELQGAVPLAVRFADDGVGWVVFHFGCDSELMSRSNESKRGTRVQRLFKRQFREELVYSLAQRLALKRSYNILDQNKKRR